MDPLPTYGAVRALSRAIHSDALKDVPRWALVRGAERLRMVGKRGVLVFDSEEETDVLAQFVLYEVLVGGTTAILRHLEQRSPPGNAVEEEFFQGVRESFSSLFRVETIRPDGVVLRDLLTPSQEPHTLVDLGLMHTGRSGLLLFTRLLPLRGYAITGGVSFAFAGKHEDVLIHEDRQLRKLARPDELSMRRYVLFHRLSKTMGVPMQFDEAPSEP